MKKTKHILKLAEKLAKENIKDSNLFTDKDLNWLVDSYAIELTRIKNSMLKGTFYAGVISVSSTGMSRKIRIAYIYKNQLYKIRDARYLALAGCDKNGRISGCGMDMLYHAQYTLFQNLHSSYKEANYSKRMKTYNDLL
jgi:5'-3' exonuclease